MRKSYGDAGINMAAAPNALSYVCGLLDLKLVGVLVSVGVELLKLMFSMCLVSESSWLEVKDWDLYFCQDSFVIGNVFGNVAELAYSSKLIFLS